jgi:DNA-binding transcriptional regulator YhcF (GntR family)
MKNPTPIKPTSENADFKVNEKKWSAALMNAGWTVLPNVFLARQKALGLDSVDLNIIMHLASYWWKPGDKPFPSKGSIADAMGVDPRTIQRRIAALEKLGFVKRHERRISKVGSKTNIYDLSGAIELAKPYAQELVELKEENIAKKAALHAKKGKPKLKLIKSEDE